MASGVQVGGLTAESPTGSPTGSYYVTSDDPTAPATTAGPDLPTTLPPTMPTLRPETPSGL